MKDQLAARPLVAPRAVERCAATVAAPLRVPGVVHSPACVPNDEEASYDQSSWTRVLKGWWWNGRRERRAERSQRPCAPWVKSAIEGRSTRTLACSSPDDYLVHSLGTKAVSEPKQSVCKKERHSKCGESRLACSPRLFARCSCALLPSRPHHRIKIGFRPSESTAKMAKLAALPMELLLLVIEQLLAGDKASQRSAAYLSQACRALRNSSAPGQRARYIHALLSHSTSLPEKLPSNLDYESDLLFASR